MALAADLERRGRRRAADEPHRAPAGQRLRVQHGRRARPADLAEQVRGRVGVVGAGADDDEQRQLGDPPREVGEHLQRRPVGPVGVVDHERERPLVGHRRAQPQHAVGDRHRGVRRRARPRRAAGRRPAPPRPRAAAPAAARRTRRAALPPAAPARRRRRNGARAAPARRGARGSRPAVASCAACSSSAVLPRPAGAATTTTPPSPPASRATAGVQDLELARALDQRRSGPPATAARCDLTTCRWRVSPRRRAHVDAADYPWRRASLPARARAPPRGPRRRPALSLLVRRRGRRPA